MIRLGALLRRELAVGRRLGGGAALGVVFFLILVSLIPFGVGPDLVLLARIGPAILWIAALLATLLGLDRLFQADRDDGSLDLLLMSEASIEAIVLVKALAHWVLTGLPLVAATPLFGLMLGMEARALAQTTAALAIGTPALTLLGAIGAALTVGLRKGGLLLAILILPLCVPILIFGVSAATAGLGNPVPFTTPLLVLAALTLASLAGAPFAAAAALRAMND
jgi:heme exporter protein B